MKNFGTREDFFLFLFLYDIQILFSSSFSETSGAGQTHLLQADIFF